MVRFNQRLNRKMGQGKKEGRYAESRGGGRCSGVVANSDGSFRGVAGFASGGVKRPRSGGSREGPGLPLIQNR